MPSESGSESEHPRPYYPSQASDRVNILETTEPFSKNSRLALLPAPTHDSYMSTGVGVATSASRPVSVMTKAPGIQSQQPRFGNNMLQQPFAIPSVKPVVDQHDRMWAELDVLDEVEMAAHETEANKSFFGESHAKVLAELQQSQLELVKCISLADKRVEKDRYESLWEQNDNSLRNNLFNQQHFDSIYKHVSKTIDKLDNVAEKMKEIDRESQEMWQSS